MKSPITIAVLLMASMSLYAQPGGVYLSVADFENGKVSYPFDCSRKSRIKLNEFLRKDFITLIQGRESINIPRDSVFGFRDCDHKIFRIGPENHYEILNPAEVIILYRAEEVASKSLEGWVFYFFSNTLKGKMRDLTRENLKREFPDNTKFHELLDHSFRSEHYAEYDEYHKSYKLNLIYAESLGKKP